MRISGAADNGWVPIDFVQLARAITVLRGPSTRRASGPPVVPVPPRPSAKIARV